MAEDGSEAAEGTTTPLDPTPPPDDSTTPEDDKSVPESRGDGTKQRCDPVGPAVALAGTTPAPSTTYAGVALGGL